MRYLEFILMVVRWLWTVWNSLADSWKYLLRKHNKNLADQRNASKPDGALSIVQKTTHRKIIHSPALYDRATTTYMFWLYRFLRNKLLHNCTCILHRAFAYTRSFCTRQPPKISAGLSKISPLPSQFDRKTSDPGTSSNFSPWCGFWYHVVASSLCSPTCSSKRDPEALNQV